MMRKIITVVVVLVVAVPIALVTTFLLTPLWRWIEATTAIESIGHSGPADWCFVAVYALTLLAAAVVWYGLTKRAKGH